MKKFTFCVQLFILLTLFINPQRVVVSASSLGYAQVNNSTTLLYRTSEADDSLSNIYCTVEQSYFVEVLSDIDADFYKVYYNGITGYIKKSKVELVSETPKKPYPSSIYFDTIDNRCYLRSSPDSGNDNVMATIEESTTDLRYIGKINGEEDIDFSGNIWYLTEYNGQIGYVYSGYTENLDIIFPNLEEVSQISNSTALDDMNPLSNTTCIIVIICILLPCLFIMFLMFKPRKLLKAKSKYKESVDIKSIEFYDDREL